jgi:hypothetical protein
MKLYFVSVRFSEYMKMTSFSLVEENWLLSPWISCRSNLIPKFKTTNQAYFTTAWALLSKHILKYAILQLLSLQMFSIRCRGYECVEIHLDITHTSSWSGASSSTETNLPFNMYSRHKYPEIISEQFATILT